MSAQDKYDEIYSSQKNALGEVSSHLKKFFKKHKKPNLQILDCGCGQGRDAKFLSNMGHQIYAFDTSKAGIKCLQEDIKENSLNITAWVGDACDKIELKVKFDIIIYDRVLHMLNSSYIQPAVENKIQNLAVGGKMLIIDEKKNIKPILEAIFNNRQWSVELMAPTFLVAERLA